MAEASKERTLQKTSTWSVAVVCVVLLAISIFIEQIIHLLGKWLKNRRKPALFEALEVVKNELMLLGFISLLLTVFQEHIAGICISEKIAFTWLPCSEEELSKISPEGRRLLDFSAGPISRRSLATKGYDKCTEEEGKVAFVTAYGIHQLHVFIFVLAIFHVLYGITTLALGTFKMRKWKVWENETKTTEYQFYNDPERFRFARDTSFGRRHLSFWSRSPISLWIVCFFRQFLGSITKVDYMVLRHGFIMAHLAPENAPSFDFQNYISRSLEEDFKVVVGISPTIWFTAVLFLLSNTHGWYSYLWLPFISLIIILMVGTKLQVIITKMGLRIQERGDVVKGTPLVQPGDELFWFGRPRFILFLIHFVLFQNAFQLAFFAWSTWQFKVQNCFHYKPEEIIIRIAMGVIIQILCSYVTMPLYALVTQMGSTMKPTIFHDRVATALRHWHHGARRHVRHSQHSNNPTPSGTAPATPEHGSSPIHLLHHYQQRSLDSPVTSPRKSDGENEQWAVIGLQSPQNQGIDSRHLDTTGQEGSTQQPNSTSNQHEIDITLSDFSFQKHA